MKAQLTSLEQAPELTFEDLQDIKIPVDLFEIIPLDFCRKNKILPLRFETQNGILSFVFADASLGAGLEDLKIKNYVTAD